MNAISWIIANWQSILAVLGGAVAVATSINALTPAHKADSVLGRVTSILNILSTIDPKHIIPAATPVAAPAVVPPKA